MNIWGLVNKYFYPPQNNGSRVEVWEPTMGRSCHYKCFWFELWYLSTNRNASKFIISSSSCRVMIFFLCIFVFTSFVFSPLNLVRSFSFIFEEMLDHFFFFYVLLYIWSSCIFKLVKGFLMATVSTRFQSFSKRNKLQTFISLLQMNTNTRKF